MLLGQLLSNGLYTFKSKQVVSEAFLLRYVIERLIPAVSQGNVISKIFFGYIEIVYFQREGIQPAQRSSFLPDLEINFLFHNG